MGDGTKKELASLDGTPVILMTASVFASLSEISRMVITSRASDIDRMRSALEPLAPFPVTFVEGGPTRQESVRLGLEALEKAEAPDVPPDYVLIHDGARPWVSVALIRRVMAGTVAHGACVPVIASPDALKRVVAGVCVEHPDRDEYRCVQTPQGFLFTGILQAHRAADETRPRGSRPFVDDAEVYAASEAAVHTTEGDPLNRKITWPHDLTGVGA
jgi:2-C-methyl-D-erythritol 4-phosphate cytidylyltransferase